MNEKLSIEFIKINLLIIAGVLTGIDQDISARLDYITIGLLMLLLAIVYCHIYIIDDTKIGFDQTEIEEAIRTEEVMFVNIIGLIFIIVGFLIGVVPNDLNTAPNIMLYLFPYGFVFGVMGTRLWQVKQEDDEHYKTIRGKFCNMLGLLILFSVAVHVVRIFG